MSTEVCPIRIDGTYCGEPATHRVRAMCVHEHQLGGPCCETCVEDARRLFLAGQEICSPCRTGASPHTCLVTAEIVPLDGVGEPYECSVCHGTFTKTRSDEEAYAEKEAMWEPVPGDDEEPGIVCDGCFRQIEAWARAVVPEAFRKR